MLVDMMIVEAMRGNGACIREIWDRSDSGPGTHRDASGNDETLAAMEERDRQCDGRGGLLTKCLWDRTDSMRVFLNGADFWHRQSKFGRQSFGTVPRSSTAATFGGITSFCLILWWLYTS
jgi:hypothetical protein